MSSSTTQLPPTGRRGPRGVQLEDVLGAADALVAQGLKPTIERVRQHLGGGSPNTVSPMLDVWFERLPARLMGRPPEPDEAEKVPLVVLQLWDAARREAEQVQGQKTAAHKRELELARETLAQEQVALRQRETAFEQARVALDEAVTSSRQAVAAMQAQMEAHQQESARLLGEKEAEVRRLRKALEEAVATKETLREKAAMEIQAKQRAADEAEERHLAQERRLLSEVDRERMATRQASAELVREQKARAADADAARAALATAQQALQAEKSAHREAASAWGRQIQETQLELATLRERAGGAEQRANDLAAQLQRQQEQANREVPVQFRQGQGENAKVSWVWGPFDLSKLRDSQTASLRQLEARRPGDDKSQRPPRPRKSSK